MGETEGVGIISMQLAIVGDGDRVHRAYSPGTFGQLVNLVEGSLFVGDGDVHAGKTHIGKRAQTTAKVVRRNCQRYVSTVDTVPLKPIAMETG